MLESGLIGLVVAYRFVTTYYNYYDEIDYILFILICIEVFVWFLLVYETLNNRLRLLIISRSYK